MKTTRTAAPAAIALALLACSNVAEVQARPGYGPGFDNRFGGGWNAPRSTSRSRDSREGRVEVTRFVATGPEAAALGHGAVSVESESGDGAWVDPALRRGYEAAIIDALVGAGYDTLHADQPQAQLATLRVSREVLVPEEEKRGPVSGTAAMEVGTGGTAYGLGINVDLTKPRSALVSTRLDARIVDRASGKVLWEGYATIATREGDGKWSEDRIATRLATALFEQFPKADPLDSPR